MTLIRLWYDTKTKLMTDKFIRGQNWMIPGPFDNFACIGFPLTAETYFWLHWFLRSTQSILYMNKMKLFLRLKKCLINWCWALYGSKLICYWTKTVKIVSKVQRYHEQMNLTWWPWRFWIRYTSYVLFLWSSDISRIVFTMTVYNEFIQFD